MPCFSLSECVALKERGSPAPVRKINHINAVYVPVFAFQCSLLGARVQGLGWELLYMAYMVARVGWFFVMRKSQHGKMEKTDPKSGVKAIYS